jgi:acetoin:2,6-dichlorophenolindophenol oxidoreductase subunit beta
MTTMTTRAALNAVLRSELKRSRETVYLGETSRDGGVAGVGIGLYEQFGPDQVIETPVSENGFFGAALGLALAGFRPIVDCYSADFLMVVANEIINDYPKWRQQQARPGALPITVRGCMGANGGLGPEHSQCMESYLHHAPGLTVIVPGSPADAAGLLRAAIRSPEPTVFFEHRRLYDLPGEVPDDEDFVLPLGKGQVVRRGRDVTVVAWAWMRQEAECAAAILEEDGISIEIVDPRTITPMDFGLIQSSVARTGTLVVAEEAPVTGSVGAEILARVMESSRDRAVRAIRVAMPNAIHPYSSTMEREILPDAKSICDAVRELSSNTRRKSVITNNVGVS